MLAEGEVGAGYRISGVEDVVCDGFPLLRGELGGDTSEVIADGMKGIATGLKDGGITGAIFGYLDLKALSQLEVKGAEEVTVDWLTVVFNALGEQVEPEGEG